MNSVTSPNVSSASNTSLQAAENNPGQSDSSSNSSATASSSEPATQAVSNSSFKSLDTLEQSSNSQIVEATDAAASQSESASANSTTSSNNDSYYDGVCPCDEHEEEGPEEPDDGPNDGPLPTEGGIPGIVSVQTGAGDDAEVIEVNDNDSVLNLDDDKDQVVFVDGDRNQINTGGGLDTVSVRGDDNRIKLGDTTVDPFIDEDGVSTIGKNTASVTGNGNIIESSPNGDPIDVEGDNNALYGQGGVLTVFGDDNTIYGDASNSAEGNTAFITADGSDNYVYGSNAGDFVSTTGDRNSIYTYGGDDDILVGGFFAGSNNSTIYAGEGNDTIRSVTGPNESNYLSGDEGKDSFIVQGGSGSTIDGGTGRDILSLDMEYNDATSFVPNPNGTENSFILSGQGRDGSDLEYTLTDMEVVNFTNDMSARYEGNGVWTVGPTEECDHSQVGEFEPLPDHEDPEDPMPPMPDEDIPVVD